MQRRGVRHRQVHRNVEADTADFLAGRFPAALDSNRGVNHLDVEPGFAISRGLILSAGCDGDVEGYYRRAVRQLGFVPVSIRMVDGSRSAARRLPLLGSLDAL